MLISFKNSSGNLLWRCQVFLFSVRRFNLHLWEAPPRFVCGIYIMQLTFLQAPPKLSSKLPSLAVGVDSRSTRRTCCFFYLCVGLFLQNVVHICNLVILEGPFCKTGCTPVNRAISAIPPCYSCKCVT
ncbi:hypothetical protein DAI22_01g406300 [Oryza sativa Japonica Group]|nr:hypothetical protein DAI22_01g406300 [Oryza sativa Japonica Group]